MAHETTRDFVPWEDVNMIDITAKKFAKFEFVRKSGLYNMFDSRAREMTNLTKDEWSTIMRDYDKLADAWLDKEKK